MTVVTGSTGSLLCDCYGSYRVYHNHSSTIYTTSLPAIAQISTRLTLDDQGAFEYLLLGSPLGRKTVFREITRTPTNSIIALRGEGTKVRGLPSLAVEMEEATFADLLEKHLALLPRSFASLVDVYGDSVSTTLSGGYDSRLMLALLRDQRVQPRVYV